MTDFKDIYSEDSTHATMTLGVNGLTGRLELKAKVEVDRGRTNELTLFSVDVGNMELKAGLIEIGRLLNVDLETIKINAENSSIGLGTHNGGAEGKLDVFNRFGKAAVALDGASSMLTMRTQRGDESVRINAHGGDMSLGGGGVDGDLLLRAQNGAETIRMSADDRHIRVRDAAGNVSFMLNGQRGDFEVGGLSRDGDIMVKDQNNQTTVHIDGNQGRMTLGGNGQRGHIRVRDEAGADRIRIDGRDGDIWFQGADLAEEFTVAAAVLPQAEPGTVMVLDANGDASPCAQRHDRKVIGVIAGAGSYQPAMILDRQGGDARKPIAMVGKVYCKASTQAGPIAVGDLLTTSVEAGHAEKVTDQVQSFGTTIGKALGPLDEGTGLIPVLVNLQ